MMLDWCNVFCTLVKFSSLFLFCLFVCLVVSSTPVVNKDKYTQAYIRVCCHSNETYAPIASLPNSAQLDN